MTVSERFTGAARKALVLPEEWAAERRHAGVGTADRLRSNGSGRC